MLKNKSGFTKLLCKGLALAFIISMFANPMFAFAKTGESDAVESLTVNILNSDGTTILVHEYTFEELKALEEIEYYATIDALPTGVGTKAKGVKISKLIEDAKKYNLDIKWESGQKLIFYVTDAPGYPYQGNDYYTYDFLYGQERYYYPNLVQSYVDGKVETEGGVRKGIDLDDPKSVEPMLASSSYQARGATDTILKDEINPVEMTGEESFRFCMGITEVEALDANFSSTNKFGRWVYEMNVGPINGARLTATEVNNEVGQSIEITISTVPDGWYDAVAKVKIGDEELTKDDQYQIETDKLIIKPGVFTEDGTYEVTVEADGFMNSTVKQTIIQSEPDPEEYTVTFMSDGKVYKTETIEAGQDLIEPDEPTKDGYEFGGWYEDEDFNNKAIFPYTVTKDVTFYAQWTEEPPEISYEYIVTPQEDAAVYDIGQTIDGIKTMKVKSGIEGLKYFKVNIQSSGDVHEGEETAIFVHLRDGKQLSINATFADFDADTVDEAGAGFNVKAGDIIKVYIVDKLTNELDINPISLQK